MKAKHWFISLSLPCLACVAAAQGQVRSWPMMPTPTSQATTASGPAQVIVATPAVATTSTAPAGPEMIQFTFPDNVEIRVLVDYVSKRLGMNILFKDEALGHTRVVISAPRSIPKDSLMGLLQSVLKMSGMAMVDAEQPGWKKIVPSAEFVGAGGLATGAESLSQTAPGTVVSQIFQLQYASPLQTQQTILPFLSKPGGNALMLAERRIIIVTDYAANVQRAAKLIELIDTQRPNAGVQFVSVRNASAGDIAKHVTMLLAEKQKLIAGANATPTVSLSAEPRTNQIAIISSDGNIEEAVELIRVLDVRETERAESNVRFYKLMNTTAASVLATIRSLESGEGGFGETPEVGTPGTSPESAMPLAQANIPVGLNEPGFAGPNKAPAAIGAESPTPPTYRDPTAASQPAAGGGGRVALLSAPSGASHGAEAAASHTEVQVTADKNTNTIIVIAPPAVQNMYKQLITFLDKRRPMVMVEVTLVAMNDNDTVDLGVELAVHGVFGDDAGRYLVFSSFGLSDVDTTTGTPSINPAAGFNGVVIAPKVLDAVVHALQVRDKSRLISAPKLLVNDNATATLASVAESPYTSVNASNTVSTTSFAGYTSAGTTITVTPHISEGDYMQLQYTVTLNSFTGTGSGGVPPPRQTSSLQSQVTLPNGYAVIVGGLESLNQNQSEQVIPGLGDIPIAKYLFGTHGQTNNRQKLFAFIRPVILRDDQFQDLKFFSEQDMEVAKLPPNLPSSDAMVMP